MHPPRWLSGCAVIGCLSACLLFAPVAEAKYGFKASPRVGGPTTTFRLSFVAPFAANGRNAEYFVEGIGPSSRCPEIYDFGGHAVRGRREVLRLTPRDDIVLARRSRWCRGSYVGVVYFQDTTSNSDNVLIGYFSFGVGRFPISLGG
jgi:hypothetical protein